MVGHWEQDLLNLTMWILQNRSFLRWKKSSRKEVDLIFWNYLMEEKQQKRETLFHKFGLFMKNIIVLNLVILRQWSFFLVEFQN